jgi:hypothetical protein
MGDVTYAPLGPWWTLDGPSLRLPGPGGRYVSVWMAGDGPCVAALAPRDSSVDSWLPLTSLLNHDVTLAATELSSAATGPLSPADVMTVVKGTGARLLLTHGDAAESVVACLDEGVLRLPVVVHAWEPTGPAAPSKHDVRFIGSPHHTIAQDAEEITALVLDVARELRGEHGQAGTHD